LYAACAALRSAVVDGSIGGSLSVFSTMYVSLSAVLTAGRPIRSSCGPSAGGSGMTGGAPPVPVLVDVVVVDVVELVVVVVVVDVVVSPVEVVDVVAVEDEVLPPVPLSSSPQA